MSIIESIILGIVQGLTEFLPISSSGHLAIAQKLFGMNETGFFLEALLHVGTLVALRSANLSSDCSRAFSQCSEKFFAENFR